MTSYHQFAQQLQRALERPGRILLTNTTGVDGDSLGSLVALGHLLDHHQKSWFAYVPEDVPAMFEYLTKRRHVMRELDDSVHEFSIVILFDTGDVRRTPLVEELAKRDPEKTFVINIDHHPTTTTHQGSSIVDLNIVDTAAASTTEMITHICAELHWPIQAPTATALLTGILTDTGHFAHPNTTERVIAAAATLMARGADHRTITTATMRNKSLGTLKLWGRALSRIAYNQHSGVVSTVITLKDYEECGVTDDAAEGIANFMNTLSEGKIALVLKEDVGGFVKGSFRTTSEVNVADMAKKFGGGGHAKAAGFRVKGKLVETGLGWQVEKNSESTI